MHVLKNRRERRLEWKLDKQISRATWANSGMRVPPKPHSALNGNRAKRRQDVKIRAKIFSILRQRAAQAVARYAVKDAKRHAAEMRAEKAAKRAAQ